LGHSVCGWRLEITVLVAIIKFYDTAAISMNLLRTMTVDSTHRVASSCTRGHPPLDRTASLQSGRIQAA